MCFRSLRENRFDAERQTIKEEEDEYQEVHSESLLQWIIHFWSAVWTDTGQLHLITGREIKAPLKTFAL